MGRGRHRGRSQRKHFKDGRENVWKGPQPDLPTDSDKPASVPQNPNGWAPFITENPGFEEYYKGQGIVKPEEWDLFMEILRKPLPAAFRVNSYSQFCDDILLKLENDFMKSLQAEAIEGGESEAIKPLPWYPKNLAWHSNFSRKQIRKVLTLQRFHEFLKLENEVGNITRQEAVSMVPPLFLDVRPNHFVLDMCAAPGSKTFQLLEIIHGSSEPGSLPSGMVVANDVDFQRSNLLIHQTKRMCTANLIVTNNEGQQFPGCRLSKTSPQVTENGFSEDALTQLTFDRVLCDVPCSGDGTLRKAPDIWRKWNSGMGNGVHSLQVLLAMRGLSVLKIGGRMIYSTCSMNPVEDEAVVAEILRRSGSSVELLDVSSELPELIRRPGLRTWKVRDKGVWFNSYKDVPKNRRGGILQSMFPSGESYKDTTENIQSDVSESAEEVSELPLERCMRILPHDQNTGAFFIAVLHKISPLPEPQEKPNPRRNFDTHKNMSSKKTLDDVEGTEEKDTEAALSNEIIEKKEEEETEKADDKESVNRKLPMQGKWVGFDPVVFLKDETVINSIKTFYGITESFPLEGHLVARNSDTSTMKRIYYVSKSVKDVLQLNFAVGQPLKIASVGLKMFERQSSIEGTSTPCMFRISSEGLATILPYITKQILYSTLADFKRLLQYKSIKLADFADQDVGLKAANLALGSCVVILDQGGARDLSKGVKVAIGCWRGRNSLSVMVAPPDCQELLERLNDTTTPSVEGNLVSEENGVTHLVTAA